MAILGGRCSGYGVVHAEIRGAIESRFPIESKAVLTAHQEWITKYSDRLYGIR